MKRPIGLLCSLAIALPGAAALASAPAQASAAAPAGSVRLPHATDPLMATYGKHVVLVVHRWAHGKPGALVAREGTTRKGRTTWGRPVILATAKGRNSLGGANADPGPSLVLAPNGKGAVAWVSTAHGRSAVVVRQHRANGTWGAPHRLAGADWLMDLSTNSRGDVAALGWDYDADENPDHVLVGFRGHWRTIKGESDGESAIGIDDHDVVHLANGEIDRGADGTVETRRWRPGHGWSRARTVKAAGTHVTDVWFAVSRSGAEYVAVGSPSPVWDVDQGQEVVYSTKVTLLKRAVHKTSYVRRWARDGAVDFSMAVDRHGVRVVWTQDRDQDSARRPRVRAVMTQRLGSRPTTLGRVTGPGARIANTYADIAQSPQTTSASIAWDFVRRDVDRPVRRFYVWHAGTTTSHAAPAQYGWVPTFPVAVSDKWLAYSSRMGRLNTYADPKDGTVRALPLR